MWKSIEIGIIEATNLDIGGLEITSFDVIKLKTEINFFIDSSKKKRNKYNPFL